MRDRDLVEERVHRLFEELAHSREPADSGGAITPVEFASVDALLADVGWPAIESDYPTESCELLFRAQGRPPAQTDCLRPALILI